ncbi:Uncharacterised protein [Acinetobacter baumannii]|uniref:hypothetical protein n=1 Tax=Acinetobacter TaxID=469 RepID=UPI000DE651D9|nr:MULTISPECIES: hypothetical protein [Acinetobacter calcoaceticus/baumannii complex]EHU1961281.1 hypothetical protein [Acinetobacter baumannii]SSI87110.1 Uncharacterised protein [Acinetobacter baumannii]SSO28528.1 Uncharacterised protein [Acinetobacter baumannii]SSP06927.1 Uncharacterised protein [Acinetobacter baumannii]HAV5314677.1 hypothetical protein [Acinetobacter baumannii]
MKTYNFIFTYGMSQSGYPSDKKCESIKKLENKIGNRQIEKWTKLDKVENTFIGELVLHSCSISEKREEAKQIVRTVFEEMMFEIEVYSDVTFTIAMLVDGLGEYLEFNA